MTMTAEQKELMVRTGAGIPGPVTVEIKRERREVFVRHGDRLRELLKVGGWPSAERVGPDAARGAWLIAQHADTQLDVSAAAGSCCGRRRRSPGTGLSGGPRGHERRPSSGLRHTDRRRRGWQADTVALRRPRSRGRAP